MGDNVEVFHGAVWAVSLTEMEAAVPPHAALASCLFVCPLRKTLEWCSRTRTKIYSIERWSVVNNNCITFTRSWRVY